MCFCAVQTAAAVPPAGEVGRHPADATAVTGHCPHDWACRAFHPKLMWKKISKALELGCMVALAQKNHFGGLEHVSWPKKSVFFAQPQPLLQPPYCCHMPPPQQSQHHYPPPAQQILLAMTTSRLPQHRKLPRIEPACMPCWS